MQTPDLGYLCFGPRAQLAGPVRARSMVRERAAWMHDDPAYRPCLLRARLHPDHTIKVHVGGLASAFAPNRKPSEVNVVACTRDMLGGRGDRIHDDAESDWMVTCIGALWPTANIDLDAITIPKASAVDATGARPLLQAKIDTRMAYGATKGWR